MAVTTDTLAEANLPTSRRGAIALGVRHYMSGKECLRGHKSARSVNKGCLECARVQQNHRLHNDPQYRALHNRLTLKSVTKRLADPAQRAKIRDRQNELQRNSADRRAKKAAADVLRFQKPEVKAKSRAVSAQRQRSVVRATPAWLSTSQRAEIDALCLCGGAL